MLYFVCSRKSFASPLCPPAQDCCDDGGEKEQDAGPTEHDVRVVGLDHEGRDGAVNLDRTFGAQSHGVPRLARELAGHAVRYLELGGGINIVG